MADGTNLSDLMTSSTSSPAVMRGGAGDDTYVLTAGSSIVENAGEGRDTVRVKFDYVLDSNLENLEAEGNITVKGNELDNLIIGAAGNQNLDGGEGNDILTGGSGNDTFTVKAGNGHDTITDFTAGADSLRLSGYDLRSMSELLSSSVQAGNDVLVRLSPTEVLQLKNLTLAQLSVSSVLFEELAPITPAVTSATDGAKGVYLNTDATAPVIIGTAGNNDIWNNGGNSQIIYGGAGDDTYYMKSPNAQIVENAGEGTDTVFTWMSFDLRKTQNVENLTVGGNNLFATGNKLDNVIRGGAGSQTIDGGLGNDVLYGGADSDTFIVRRGGGSDRINDFVSGQDKLVVYDTAYANRSEMLSKAVQSGNDVLIRLGAGEVLTVKNVTIAQLDNGLVTLGVSQNPPAPVLSVPVPVSTAAPGAIAVNLFGTDGNDTLYTSSYKQVFGGAGNDTYYVHNPNSTQIIEQAGGGVDTVVTWNNYTLAANVENATISGSEAKNLIGNALNNRLIGQEGAQRIDSKAGNDTLSGGAGRDTFVLSAGNGSDVITDFNGDVLAFDGFSLGSVSAVMAAATQVGANVVINLGNGQNVTLNNFTKDSLANAAMSFSNVVQAPVAGQTLTGTSANNVLTSGAGNDVLNGLGGNDTLTGGAGSDRFIVAFNQGSDVITDFKPGTDKLDVSSYGYLSSADVLANARQSESDTIIWLHDGQRVTLKGVSLQSLHANDIVLSGAPAVVNGTSGNDSLSQASNSIQTLIGGAGNDTYYLGKGGRIIEQENGGIDRIIAWSSVDLRNFANVENLTASGADNNVRNLIGNSLNNEMSGGGGRQNLWGGEGNDTLYGGADTDLFVVSSAAGQGSDVIKDFTWGVGGDRLRIDNSAFRSFEDIKNASTQIGSDVVIHIGNSQTLTLKNTTLAQMDDQNIADFAPRVTSSEMVFAEEFNSLDMRSSTNTDGMWKTFGYWGSRTLGSNGETQTYVDPEYKGMGLNPFSVNNGVLTITAEKASSEIAKKLETGTVNTSGMLTSEGTFSIQYGYIEMKAELPNGASMWPAFWLLADDGQWPPEIDIFEVLSVDPNTLHTTEHWKDDAGAHKAVGYGSLVSDTSQGMHTYGIDWGPDEMVWYYDGVEVYRAATNPGNERPMYMLINLATGGWGGAENKDTWTKPDGNKMDVDYVRVYEREDDTPSVALPAGWEDDTFVFGTVTSAGSIAKGAWTNTMKAGEVAAHLVGSWDGRYLVGNDLDDTPPDKSQGFLPYA